MRKAAVIFTIGILTLSILVGQLIFNSENAVSDTVIYESTITIDETWNLTNSPYYIEGNVTVAYNVNLTIEPGVEVRFNGPYGLYIGGNLTAVGNASDMIKFTSNSTSPGPGNWSSININLTGRATIRYSNITYANYGIEIIESLGCDIRYNNITDNYYSGITLSQSSNNTIANNNIMNSYFDGITAYQSSNNTISDNNITDNQNNGVFLSESWENHLSNNNISENWFYGVFLSKSSDNNITTNRIWSNYRGIYLSGVSGAVSQNNIIGLNSIQSNTEGIRLLSFCPNNVIFKNNISSNNQGINLTSSSNNRFYHNIFWYNTKQAYDDMSTNFWDNGYPFGGNYWSDFDEPNEGAYDNLTGPNQDEEGSDGIIDDPYMNIGGGAGTVDNYPLIGPSIERTFVYLISPINNSVVINGTILDFIVIGDDVVLVNYSIDGGVTNWSLSYPWNISTTGWPDGPYIIDFFVYDGDGNITEFWFNVTIDSVMPEIILNSPPAGSLIIPGVKINLTVLDDNLAVVNYTLNSGSNYTLLAPYNIDTTTWPDGNYTVQVYAMDMASNLNTTIYNFTIDGSGPSIILFDPANNSVIKPGIFLQFNITDAHLNTSTINYSVNDTGPYTFITPYEIDTTAWLDGNYIIEVNATDILGNAIKNFFNITIDSTPPFISLISPANNSIITEEEILDFNVEDNNLDVVNYTINFDINETLVPPFDINTTSWSDGPYRIDIFATDLAGNTNSSYYNFTFAILPRIILTSPQNNSIIKAGGIIDFSIEDTNLDYANYSINGAESIKFFPPYIISTSGWPDGNYIIEIQALDEMGNTNYSWYYFTFDSTPPLIILNSPLNNSVIPSGTNIDFEISDAHLNSVNYSFKGGPSYPFLPPYDFDTSSWGEGEYTIIIRTNDTVDNENISEFVFIIDSTPPIIQLISPPNGTSVEAETPINLSITDDNLDFVNFTVNAGANHTLPFPFSINTKTFPDGNCIVVIYAIDLAGNLNTTWYNFTFLDTTKPFIVLNSPENQSVVPAGTIIDLLIYDLHLRNVSYSLDNGFYVEFSSPYDINTSDWYEGMHTLVVFADDNRSNMNTSIFVFTIDSVHPSIFLISPLNNSVVLPGAVLDFNIIEDNLKTVNYSVNDGDSNAFSSPFDISTTGWEEGSYIIVVHAEDKAGNKNTAWFRIIIDSTPPLITLIAPINGSSIQSKTIIDVTVIDANIDVVEYSINDGVMATFPSPYDFNTTGWNDGDYTIRIQATDGAGNTMSAYFTFTLDSIPPEVSHISVVEPYYPYEHTRIFIYFTESMNKESAESTLNITPDLNYTVAWYDDDKTMMLMNIEGLEFNEFYLIHFDEGCSDIAGNLLVNFSSHGFVATIDIYLDSDEDGMPDGWEFYYGLDPNDPSDADDDIDDDRYTNLEEFEGGSDPRNPDSIPLKPKEKASTLEYWWLIPILIALLIVTVVLFIMLLGERKEEPKGPVEELEDMYLAMRAEKNIKSMESILEDEERLKEKKEEAKIIVQKAKEAFEKGDYNLVTVYDKTLKDLVGEEVEEGEVDEYEMEEEKTNEET